MGLPAAQNTEYEVLSTGSRLSAVDRCAPLVYIECIILRHVCLTFTRGGTRDHVTASLRQLHWLPVPCCVTFNLCCISPCIQISTATQLSRISDEHRTIFSAAAVTLTYIYLLSPRHHRLTHSDKVRGCGACFSVVGNLQQGELSSGII